MADNFSDTIREREQAQEAKYKFDEERRFKAEARRNKLLGFWVAEKLGMTSKETEAYAKEVVIVDLQEPGVEDVISKVLKDFEKNNVTMTRKEIQKQLDSLFPVAMEQIAKEFPKAL